MDSLLQTIAEAVGDWYFRGRVTKEIDCPYPCNNSCHNLIPQIQVVYLMNPVIFNSNVKAKTLFTTLLKIKHLQVHQMIQIVKNSSQLNLFTKLKQVSQLSIKKERYEIIQKLTQEILQQNTTEEITHSFTIYQMCRSIRVIHYSTSSYRIWQFFPFFFFVGLV